MGHELFSSSHHRVVASLGSAFGASIEDVIDVVLEDFDLGISFGIASSIDFLDVLVRLLQCVKDTLVVDGVWKDLSDHRSIVDSQIGDPVLGRTGQVRRREGDNPWHAVPAERLWRYHWYCVDWWKPPIDR